MNFVISHRQTSQSDSNPVILLRNRCTSNCCRLHPNTRPGSCTTRRNLYNIYIYSGCTKRNITSMKKIQHMMNHNIDDDNKNSWLIIVHFSSGENHLVAFIIFYFYFIKMRFSWNIDLIFCWSLNQIGNESITDAFFCGTFRVKHIPQFPQLYFYGFISLKQHLCSLSISCPLLQIPSIFPSVLMIILCSTPLVLLGLICWLPKLSPAQVEQFDAEPHRRLFTCFPG